MKRDNEAILAIIDATPLVSVDLIIKNPDNRVLLGKRLNRPAKDFWFVPGGRIGKNEPIADATRRISEHELGLTLTPADGTLIGAYDHIYPDNFLNREGINTHYVVIAYQFNLTEEPVIRMDDQHSAMRWFAIDTLLDSADVHSNSKAYFLPRDN